MSTQQIARLSGPAERLVTGGAGDGVLVIASSGARFYLDAQGERLALPASADAVLPHPDGEHLLVACRGEAFTLSLRTRLGHTLWEQAIPEPVLSKRRYGRSWFGASARMDPAPLPAALSWSADGKALVLLDQNWWAWGLDGTLRYHGHEAHFPLQHNDRVRLLAARPEAEMLLIEQHVYAGNAEMHYHAVVSADGVHPITVNAEEMGFTTDLAGFREQYALDTDAWRWSKAVDRYVSHDGPRVECWDSATDTTHAWSLPLPVQVVSGHLGAAWGAPPAIWACDEQGGLWRLSP